MLCTEVLFDDGIKPCLVVGVTDPYHLEVVYDIGVAHAKLTKGVWVATRYTDFRNMAVRKNSPQAALKRQRMDAAKVLQEYINENS